MSEVVGTIGYVKAEGEGAVIPLSSFSEDFQAVSVWVCEMPSGW